MFDTSVRNVMFDLASKKEIFDAEENRVISRAEANDVIRKACFEKLGLNEKSTDKEIKRALKKEAALDLFAIIEEIVDVQIAHGWTNNEFFNQYVEMKNLKDGDANEFWAEDEIILNVAKVSGDHHDLLMQRLNFGQSYSVPTAYYAVKVGGDIRLFLTGKRDWNALVDAVVKAYANKIQTEIYSQFVNGTNLYTPPSVLTGTGTLGAATKAQLDAIIEKVESANECDVVIMGTKTALKNLNALSAIPAVDWVAESQKESIANTGIIGSYEGVTLLQLPQKFTDKTLATPLIDNTKLYIMPVIGDKFVKFVDYGETELEIKDAGDTMDDMQSVEVQRRFGIATMMTRYYGIWTI